MLFSVYGLMPFSYASVHTGAMSSSVMNSAIDVMTWLGGNCCVPSACRKQTEHDDDPHEAGRHQQDRRREAHDREQQHHLQRRA